MRPGIAMAAAFAVGCSSLEGLSGSTPDGGTAPGEAGTSPTCTADLANDIDNCGTCGTRCLTRANGVPSCAAGKCKTTCITGFGDCDGNEANGCEASLASDGKHCGACGHDCRGGGCNASTCEPVTIASAADGPSGIAMDATDVYWVSFKTSTVWACAKTGCPNGPRKVGTGSGTTYFVSVDANNVYFNSNSTDTMFRCPKSGCTGPATSMTIVDAPTLNIVDEGFLYWSCNTGEVHRMPVDATNVPSTLLAAGVGDPAGLAVDGSFLYVNRRSAGQLVRIPKTGLPDGGAPETMTGSFPGGQAMAIDSSGVYVGTNTGEIKRYANGTTTTFSTGPGGVGYAIALTANDVFWTVFQTTGAIMTAPKATGVARILAGGQVTPKAVVADDASVWWTNENEGTVKMLVR